MRSTDNIAQNLEQAELLLIQAKNEGAVLAVLPENFACMGHHDLQSVGEAELQGTGLILPWLSRVAKKLGLWIQAGTIPLPPDDAPDKKVRACALLIDDQGNRVARYDKIHLFDAEVQDKKKCYKESDSYGAGSQVVAVDTPVGRLGITVCYDMRFAELYTLLRRAGAELICVPAAFTKVTGEAHWQSLLRARAIETQCYILAAAQEGVHNQERETWGHSCIIDPWGKVLALSEQGNSVLVIERQPLEQEKLRQAMPIMQHRRLTVSANPLSVLVEEKI